MSEPQPAAKLKFADEHVGPILRGQKTVTLRPTLDTEIQIGDRLHLCDEDGERFASVPVDDRGYTSISMAARMDWDGHQNYNSVDELLSNLNECYPEMELEATDSVEIIRWNWEEIWE